MNMRHPALTAHTVHDDHRQRTDLSRRSNLRSCWEWAPAAIDTWVSKRMIPVMRISPRMHRYDVSRGEGRFGEAVQGAGGGGEVGSSHQLVIVSYPKGW